MFQKMLLYVMFVFSLAFSNATLDLKKAFNISHASSKNGVELNFKMGQNIYIYKDTFDLKLGDKSVINLLNMPTPTNSNGYEIFMQDFSIFVPINLIKEHMQNGTKELRLEYQGCAKNGICYRPQFKNFTLFESDNIINLKEIGAVKKGEISDEESIANTLFKSSFLASLVTFFGFGVLLSLTPCVFPMIPILSSIIIKKGKSGFMLSLFYVFGMSLAYSLAGIGASIIGLGIQGMLQNPYVLGFFATIFVALAFSMFGFYDIKLPLKFENFISKKTGLMSGFFGVFIMGFASALVVSPCVAAPLAGALLYISQSGNTLYGGIMLFVMGFAMGLPLLVLGASSGRLLPKPGVWMDVVKNAFGFLMLLMAVWLLARVFNPMFEMVGYGVIGVVWAVFLGAFDSAKSGGLKFKKAIALLLFIYSVMLLVGGFSGSKDVFSPLSGLKFSKNVAKNELNFKKVNTLDELNMIIKSSKKPVLLDFWANWCVSCKELDNKTFADKNVVQRLENFTLIKVDVTKGTSEDDKILRNFSLINPPALLFFKDGDEIREKRVIGYIDAKKFMGKTDSI